MLQKIPNADVPLMPDYQIPMVPLVPREMELIEEGSQFGTKRLNHVQSAVSGFGHTELEQHIL